MATLYVLSSRGDQRVSWSPEAVQAGDPEALEAIAQAEAILARELRRGSSAFRLLAGQPAVRIDRLDGDAEEIVIIPRMAGG
jgi:hypothetical protein